MKGKRIFAALTASAMLLMQSAVMPAAVQAADSSGDDWLHVEGNKILDMQGNEVWLTGVNWFGYNVGSAVFDGVWCANMHECLQAIADHGFNLLRVPMSTQIILQWKNKEPDALVKVGEWENPELTVEGVPGGKVKYSYDIWKQAVEWCKECGIKIMMDIHCATTNAAGHNYPLWYDESYSTKDWLTALEWFCSEFKNDDTVVAIDLKNEPHGKPEEGKFAKWDDSTDENNWKYAAERGAEACLSVNPNLLIMVEGVECYPDFDSGADWSTPSVDYARYGEFNGVFGAWWGANLRGVRKLPINEKYKSHIVYSPHDYGPSVYAQTWFAGDYDEQSLLDDYWYDTWAYINEEGIAPLLMGEWGGHLGTSNEKWMGLLRDYMIKKHIHHTFWCFNENSSDTGGLVDVDFKTWDEEKYNFIKSSLWQDDKGVFVGLDHQIPLGANGQTVSEYYGGPASTRPPKEVTTTVPDTTTTTEPAGTTLPEETPEPGTEVETVKWGDVDVNGTVAIADAVLLSRFCAEDTGIRVTTEGKRNSDVNGDRRINSDDITVILEYLANIRTEAELAPPNA